MLEVTMVLDDLAAGNVKQSKASGMVGAQLIADGGDELTFAINHLAHDL